MRTLLTKIFRWVYTLSASLFLVGVLAQVFLAGLAVVARRAGWSNHISLGHGLSIPLLLMLFVMFPARLPSNIKWLSALLFGIYFVQADVVILLRDSLPYVSALHPVLALFDFLLVQHLARITFRLSSSREVASQDSFHKARGVVNGPNLVREA